jgi:hypothetical protein
VVGLRDRAMISVMTFAFARVGAVVAMVSVSRWPPAESAPRKGYFGQPAGSGLMSTIVWLMDIISSDSEA